MMTSALLRNGPDHLRPLETRVRDWMDRHGDESVDQLRGRLDRRRGLEHGDLVEGVALQPQPRAVRVSEADRRQGPS
jgi:hypothetical protein